MSLLTILKGAMLGSLLTVPSVVRAEVAADPDCWRTDETEAARFEDFRLKVLVGALNCKNYLPGAAASYNTFLATKKEMVLANMYVVRTHFIHEAGMADGADQFANYETLAGNKYSSPTFDRAKCETVDASLKLATSLSDAELVKMVAVLSPGPLPSGCKIIPRPISVLAPPVAVPPAQIVAAVVIPAPISVPVAVAPVAVAATLTPAVLVENTGPMTDAQRIAASTAATRQLIASRASLTKPVLVPTEPLAPVIATAPVAQAVAIPATLAIVDAKPVTEAKPAKVELASIESAKVEPAPVQAAIPPSAAQALAEAAKALAAAAAALQTAAR